MRVSTESWRLGDSARFVEHVEAPPVKTIQQQGKERFAVRLLVQRTFAISCCNLRSVRRFSVQFLDFGRDIEKAFRAQEEPVGGLWMVPSKSQMTMEFRM